MLNIKTKEEFDNIVDMIRLNVKHYETYLTEVHYKLYFANRKAADISYHKDCIAHLLGLDLDYLRSLNYYREKSSYELMKKFLDNSYTVYSKLDNPGKVFSDYVVTKNEIFKDNLKIVVSDIDCVVEYKKDRIYGLDALECPCDYYILQKRDDQSSQILLLGIIRRGNEYVPQTSQRLDLTLSKDRDSLKNILFHQNITFCNNLHYSNSYDVDAKAIYLDLQSRSDKMLSLNRYSIQYNSCVVVDGDYGYILKRLTDLHMNANKMKSTLQDITSMIVTGEIIDISSIGDDSDCDIKELVMAYNNSRTIEKSSFKYSELLEEYNKLKQEVENLKLQNEKLNTISTNQAEAIEKLENEGYKETHDKILTLLQNVNGGGVI